MHIHTVKQISTVIVAIAINKIRIIISLLAVKPVLLGLDVPLVEWLKFKWVWLKSSALIFLRKSLILKSFNNQLSIEHDDEIVRRLSWICRNI